MSENFLNKTQEFNEELPSNTLFFMRDPTDPILDMYVSWQKPKFWQKTCCLQDQTELLDRYSLTSSIKNSSKSQFLVFTNVHLFI